MLGTIGLPSPPGSELTPQVVDPSHARRALQKDLKTVGIPPDGLLGQRVQRGLQPILEQGVPLTEIQTWLLLNEDGYAETDQGFGSLLLPEGEFQSQRQKSSFLDVQSQVGQTMLETQGPFAGPRNALEV